MSVFRKTWDPKVVSEYIKQESQQKSPETFLETHIPIRKIRAESLVGHGGDFVSDRELFGHVTQSSPDDEENRIYLLKGEVGSGKSHLCQWLEYQINGEGDLDGAEDHVAIHISRNNTRLGDILGKLYEHIDDSREDLRDIDSLDASNLADFIISGLRTFEADQQRFAEFDLYQFIEDNSNGPDLRSVLKNNIERYQQEIESGNNDGRFEPIDQDEFGEICLLTFGSSRTDGDAYSKVRSAIHDLVLTNVGIEDFQGELKDIADQYQREGKRPVLICEDVTTFSVLKDGLLDHIFQLGDGGEEIRSGFDVLLGYTTGWETEEADDALVTGDLSYMRQRSEGYLSMTNREGKAYFLEEGAMPIQLVEQYLRAIKTHSEVEEVPEVDDTAFDGLYPFSKRFVMRVYAHLEEDGNLQQTPRLLLYHVVGDCLRSDVPPHQKLEGHGYIREFTGPTEVGRYSEEFLNVVKWYGRMDGGEVATPVACFDAFDVELPNDVTVTDGEVRLGVLYEDVGWEVADSDLQPVDTDTDPLDIVDDAEETGDESPVDQTEGGEQGSEEGAEERAVTPPSDPDSTQDRTEESERARRIAHFRSWYGSGGEFPSSNRLKEGVRAALNMFYDPTRLANENATTTGTAGVYLTRGDDVPVEIRGADASKERSIKVSHQAGDSPAYERMLYEMMIYGLEGEFRADANFDAIRGWVDDRVVRLRGDMRDEIETVLPEEMTIEEFVVLARLLLLNGAHGTTELDRAELLRDPNEYELSDNSPFARSNTTFDTSTSLESGFRDLATKRSDVANLCRGFFLLKENFVDHDRVGPAVESVTENLDEYVTAITRMSASELPDAYRIGTTRRNANTRVSGLFETVSDYASELRKLEQSFDGEEIVQDVERVRDIYSGTHTVDDLAEYYERLFDCLGKLGITKREKWETAYELVTDADDTLSINQFGRTLRKFRDVDPESGIEVIAMMYAYNESRTRHDEWMVYETLAEMIEEIDDADDADVSEFTQLVRDSPEFIATRERRDRVVELVGGI